MPTKVLKAEEEVKDFVRGCTFMGTGGGGSPEGRIGEGLVMTTSAVILVLASFLVYGV